MPRKDFKNRAKRIAELRGAIADLREAGQSITGIAKTLKMSPQAVQYHLKKVSDDARSTDA